mmetsp:Transcript_5848/g.11140  ORF Transcript_5848/g.11140 Transcript_5848/m.11140 type:complete len:540 (+) Transcript_5848:12-1631(+)|eukprot:CAMPEP_0175138850 /NCGR_PEP_ID=MMETSP0087-20121206/10575_1 /TAXON_ID=136419 /ORGANISM="Unknown Unknown, Strain D1" /LENGTH=539 /DNA_ID=CAMNT_0016421793 /DNA_START=12 /DNA_END=1631 /DNA_ORIENTATION=+
MPNKKKKGTKKQKKGPTEEELKEREAQIAEAQAWLDSLEVEQVVSEKLFQEQPAEGFKDQFNAGTPFRHCRIDQFLDEAFADKLLDELTGIEYFKKSNDLYSFVQSNDLKSVTTPLVSKFRDVLYSDKLREALQRVTGIALSPLSEDVSMFAAVYQNGDRLLCHDDDIQGEDKDQGRRIAYIMYLTPKDWTEKDGGCLDLFGTDEQGNPHTIAKSLVPKWNSFTFFEVSDKSYHQVAEVTSLDKNRITVGGWFHGQALPRRTNTIDTLPPCLPFTNDPPPPAAAPPAAGGGGDEKEQVCENKTADWLSSDYRKKHIIKKVNKRFCEDSSIELTSFLRTDKYSEVLQALESAEWVNKGPAHKRSYGVLNTSSSESQQALLKIQSFFQSQAFADSLAEMTGLELQGISGLEFRRFCPGNYTLAHDFDPENRESGLDVVLSFLGKDAKKREGRWQESYGGAMHFLMEGQDEELLSVDPAANNMAMVYRSAGGVLRFVRYVNNTAKVSMYQLAAVVRTVDDSEEDEQDSQDDDEEMEEPEAKK